MMKKWPVIFAVSTALILTACGLTRTNKKSTEISDFMAFYETVYAPQDEMLSVYLAAMEEIGNLKEESSAENEGHKILAKAYEAIEETEIPDFKLTPEIESYMEESLLSIEEFTAFSGMAASDQAIYLDELDYLINAIETSSLSEENSLEQISEEGKFQYQLHSLYSKYNYYAANEFFAVLKKKDQEYVRDFLTEHFSSCRFEGADWKETADEALDMEEAIWKEIEALSR